MGDWDGIHNLKETDITPIEKLKSELGELFQLDQAGLKVFSAHKATIADVNKATSYASTTSPITYGPSEASAWPRSSSC